MSEANQGWITAEMISARFFGVSTTRVLNIISMLGMNESTSHIHTTMHGLVYSPELVALVTRELRSRGATLRYIERRALASR